ncbi:HutD family protein [Rhizobium sp. 007]|uniref:HutD/Ves family protein n=1 Tax=Rhizobium sp. 007 TaxID=2785056 RepID=UPI00188E0A28|nr:HutD family protein [Rhizobium sp. 007]QPB23168.1 HutD family protein [Rhizobium sp. 007]
MQILRAANHRRMPWKNGGGETVEVAVSPQGATLGDFDWRVSMATVAFDGPFSIFPGIDRTLSILSGSGMTLEIDGHEPVLLAQQSPPFAFAADIAVTAQLIAGPITDLNVMTRRDAFMHKVERLHIERSWSGSLPAAISLVLCHEGEAAFELAEESGMIYAGDVLMIEAHCRASLTLAGAATCYLISITAV